MAVIVFEISCLQNFIMTLNKGHNSTKGDNPELKKTLVNYFLMRNPYMKFQNCILINFVTDPRTDEQKDKPKAICPFNFCKVGGINRKMTILEHF